MGAVATIVTVGDELLLGQTVDSNAAWLSERLTTIGLPVRSRWTVGDSDAAIAEALSAAMAVSQVVFFSGGLGPTSDDRTREAVAAALGMQTEEDKDWRQVLEARFRERGYPALPPTNRRQFMVPVGAQLLANDLGTAPGLAIDAEDTLILLFPGVPRELKWIYTHQVEARLRERFAGALMQSFERRIHTTGIAESVLAEQITAAVGDDLGPVQVGYYPDLRGVDLVLRVSGTSRAEAHSEFDRLDDRIKGVVDPFIFESTGGDLVEAIAEEFVSRRENLGVAESCTGGLIAKRLTDMGGASRYFRGGVIAYDNDVKQKQLGISEETLRAHGAVSEVVAAQMAEGIARLLGTHAGIGVTGVAGPGGGTPDKPVGTVWYAAHLQGRTQTEMQIFVGNREAIRERAAQAALALLYRMLQEDTRNG